MHDLALIAASEWAKTHAGIHHDPVEFGQRVAQVYLAARTPPSSASDEILKSSGFADKSRPAAPLDRGPTFLELLRSGVISSKSFKPTPAPEQRANALELSAILSRFVSSGSVIDGANLLADKFASLEGYERAAELILRASPTTRDQPLFASWKDLIEAADAVAAWLRTGESGADLAVLQRAFPSVSAYQ